MAAVSTNTPPSSVLLDDDVNEEAERNEEDYPFNALSREARDFYVAHEVERIAVPDPLVFYRDYVAKNKPVIIQGAIDDWPALQLWSNEYLVKALGDAPVTIDVTPDGFGDSVKGEYFVTPYEEDMTFAAFVDILSKKNTNRAGVHYCQHQNSSLTTQFNALMSDMKIPAFANIAFGSEPDAANFWMGDASAISSSHHDPYENIYCVVTGEKHFTLHPPTDLYWMGQTWFKKAQFEKTEAGEFKIVPDPSGQLVPWFPVDEESLSADLQAQYPHARYHKSTPLRVVLRAGETLYLPSLWYHRVSQRPDSEGRTIAINFWYDMQFDSKYTYFRFMENIMNQRRPKVMGAPAPKKETKKEVKQVVVPSTPSPSTPSSAVKLALPSNTVAVSGVNPLDPTERDMMIGGLKIRVRDKTDEEMARDTAVQSLIRAWQEEKAKALGESLPLSGEQKADQARATLEAMESHELAALHRDGASATSTFATGVPSSLAGSQAMSTKIWLPPAGHVLETDSKKQLEDQVRAMLERWEYESDQRAPLAAAAAANVSSSSTTAASSS